MSRIKPLLSIIFISGFFIVSGSAFAAGDNTKGIVVWKLEKKTGVSKNDIDSISGMITSDVEKYSGRKVVSEADIRTILKGEETRQKCGVEDTSCIAEIGAALGVPEAISGDLGRVGNIWVLNLRRINIRDAEVIKRATRQMDGDIDDLMLVVPSAVAELFGKEQPTLPGILSVQTTPEGAVVMSGQRELGQTPLKKRLEAGEYTLTVRLDGYLETTRKVTIKSGEKTSSTLTLTRIPMNPYKLYGHMTFWSGLGLVALGSVFTGMTKVKMDEHDDMLGKGDVEAAQDARDTSKTYGGLAVTGYSIGGALMVTGLVLWILSPGDEAWANEHLLSAGPIDDGRGFGLSVGGKW